MKLQRARTDATPTDAKRAVAALAALAQETRLAIFRLLIEYAPDGLTAGAIALQLKLPPATLSFHLKELASAGLILDRRESRFIWYRANLAGMNGLLGYLTENCCRASGTVACDSKRAPAASCRPSTPQIRSQR